MRSLAYVCPAIQSAIFGKKSRRLYVGVRMLTEGFGELLHAGEGQDAIGRRCVTSV